MQVQWQIKSFDELDIHELYNLISLRISVFVLEQQCLYQELDDKDKVCFHLIGKDENNQFIAYARILPPGLSYSNVSIGRVLTDMSVRSTGIGHQLIEESLRFIHYQFENVAIQISAQKHLEKFYNRHGFERISDEYLEDGIPHIEMLRFPII
jgi:ElaA protein